MAQRDGPQKGTMGPIASSHNVKVDKNKLTVHNESNYSYLTCKSTVGVKVWEQSGFFCQFFFFAVPTASLCGQGGGKWYHEVKLDTNSQMLIGFCTSGCNMENNNGQGLGNDGVSWGWDGYNCQAYHKGNCESYGDRQWRTGDIIGLLLDLDQRKIVFSKNGNEMGAAFSDIPRDVFLYPAVSLKRYQKCTYNFGETAFRHPSKVAFPMHMVLNDKQKAALEKLFDHYQKVGFDLSESQEDRGDICKADGVFQFANDVGATDDTDPLLLVVAWKLGAEHPWEFAREEWVNGFSLYGLHDISGIKKTAGQWKDQVMTGDSANFKPFYNWCFDYLREERKILTIEEVQTLWAMLAMSTRWPLWDRWIDFLLNEKKRNHLTRDEWCVVLVFSQEYPTSIDNYDPDGPWSSLIDDFTEWLENKLKDE